MRKTMFPNVRPGTWPLLCIGVVALLFAVNELAEHFWIEAAGPVCIYTLQGVGVCLLLAGLCAWYLLRHQVPLFKKKEADDLPVFDFSEKDGQERFRHHAAWMASLRWLVVVTGITLLIFAHWGIPLIPEQCNLYLLGILFVLGGVNLLYQKRVPATKHPRRLLRIQTHVDLLVLTGLLHFSGGVENPLFVIYLFHVIISGILLGRSDAYTVATVSLLLCSGLAVGEMLEALPHYTIAIFPHNPGREHAAHHFPYVGGRLLTLGGVLFGTAYFTTMIVDQLRKGQERLRRAAQSAVMEERRMEGIVDAAGAGLLLLSKDRRILWANRKAREWSRTDRPLEGERCAPDAVGDLFGCETCAAEAAIRTGKTQRQERVLDGKDGQKRFLLVVVSPVLDARGQVEQVVELIQDITDRKALEAEMIHAGKMATLGRVAAGIAHEIGNPLSSLSMRIELLRRHDDDPFHRESVELLQKQVERIGRIVHGVSQFARKGKDEWSPCRIEETLAETVRILAMDRRAKAIRFLVHHQRDMPPIRCACDQVSQVFLNIGINALESMPAGGDLKIESRHEDGSIRVAFTDTGGGIPEENRPKLFESFFTTKREGSGLGLAISDHIVHAHGGRIRIDSQVGKGTVVTVILPLNEATRRDG